MANRRDLTIGIDGDAKGFDAACEEAEAKARGLDRELSKLERQQIAQERVTARTTAAVRRYASAEDKAALAARKKGVEAKRAADQAEKAEVRATAAAEAARKGLLDEAVAAKIAAKAEDSLERAAIKAAEAQIAEAAAAEQLAREEEKAAEASDKHRRSTEGVRGGLVSLAAAGAAIAAPVGAAGIAFVGLAALAVPSIKKVIDTQSDLATNWDTLDKGQRVAASGVHSLISEYKTLAKSYEPDALLVFNGAVSTSRQLLPELGKTVAATKNSVADFATSMENTLGREVPRLAGIVRSNANPALNELGTTFDQTSTLAVSLVHDLAPVGLQFLGVANGGLRFLNALEQINPHLVEVGATMLAVRAPASALGNLWTGGATKLGRYGKAAGEAEKTTATLSKTVGSSPNLYIGAALAVGLLSYRWATAKSALDNRVDGIRAEASATKNSVATHQRAIEQLNNETVGWTTYYHAMHASNEERKKHASESDPSGSLRVTKQIAAEQKAVTNITQGENLLAKQYGLTAAQADALATAAGVDLAKGITGSGSAATAARAKLDQYVASLKSATDTSLIISTSLDTAGNKALDLKTRLAALDAAFGALAGPELQAYDSTTKTAGAFSQMDAALKKSKGSLSLNTAAGRDARTAFAGLLSTVEANSTAQYQYESVTLGVTRAKANLAARAKEMLPLLLAETHGSKAAANAALDWANSQGLGKTRTEALTAILDQGKSAFLVTAHNAGLSTKAANQLWAAFNKLPQVKDTKLNNNAKQKRKEVEDYQAKLDALHGKTVTIKDNAAAAQGRVNRVQAAINALHNRTVTLTTRHIIETIEIAHRTSQAERADALHGSANGNIFRFANGGENHVAQVAKAGDWRLWAEPETGGEAYIPLSGAKRKRSTLILSEVAKDFGLALVKPMADGGIQRFATGGITGTDVSLSDVLQHWTDVRSPTTKAQVDAAVKARKTQINQLKSAEDSLYRARHARHKSARDIAAAERRVAAERDDVAAATKKLADVEQRYKYGKMSPATQLGSALGQSIKDTGAFIANLTTLANRGFGVLAQHLLAQGDVSAEKTAADAVKMSSSKLGGLQKQVQQADQQQTSLANLGGILTIKSAMTAGANSWDTLIAATGLAPNDLAASLKLMTADLQKTAAGQALLAMMKAHGFVRGGPITGPAGTDRVPLWGTAGEYVVPKAPAAANRALLDAMTSGRPIAAGMVRGGDGAAAGRPIIINVYARDNASAIATAKATSHELGWEMKRGGA